MQQFVVPQFIEVEDKILGPITVRQFIIMLFGGVLVFIAYRLADFVLFVILTAIIGGLVLIFAFVKVNGQTFHYFLLNIFQTLKKPGKRIWRKDYSKKELNYLRKAEKIEEVDHFDKKHAKRTRIRDLALVVNTGGYYRPEEFE